MNKSPLISVVMPVFNGGRFLHAAVGSILRQTYTNFEFIIINDGSTDNTKKILDSFHDPRIKIISHTTNQGIVKSLNAGITKALGKYVARMDADDVSDPRRFRLQVDYLGRHPKCAVVGSYVKITKPDGVLMFTIEQPTSDQAIKQFLQKNSCLAHGSVMMRKSAIVAVGGYSDSTKVRHAEDYDLFVRLASKYQLGNIAEYLYTRKEHAKSISHMYFRKQQQSASYISRRAKKYIKLTKAPKFSILMPAYNSGEYIGDAIKSVTNQIFQNWELIIVDDNSVDDTKAVVQKFRRDTRIKYFKNPQNLGKGRTRRRLVLESTAHIFGELDADDALDPKALSIMYQAHKKYPRSGLIYSQFAYADADMKHMGTGFCRPAKPGETNLHSYFASAFRTYKRDIFSKTSGFDPNLSGAEDKDVVYKMEEVAPISFVDKELYKYRNKHAKSYNDTAYGLISNMKAKYFAYMRRRSSGYHNLTIFGLLRSLANDLFLLLKYQFK